MRTFVLVAGRARPDPELNLNDLPGAGGRFDVVARFVTSALLVSHGVRRGDQCIVVFAGDPDSPRALRLRGDRIKGFRPDERSTAARLAGCLGAFATPVWQEVKDGVELSSKDLADVLGDHDGPVVLLDESGSSDTPPDDAMLVLGDDRGLSAEHEELVRAHATHTWSLGPVSLQADQAVVVAHNRFDTAP